MKDTFLLKTTIFCEGLDHPECVVAHPDGSIWAGGEAGQIYRISPDGENLQIMADTGGFILGMALSPGSEWMAICDLGKKCVWKYELETNDLSLLTDGAKGHKFNIPNYPVFDRSGNLYISESGAFGEISGRILKYDIEGECTIWHEGPFNFANGLALDVDERNLFVVCSWLPGVRKIKVNDDGTAGKDSVYATIPQTVPDGLAFDELGNLLVSCYAPNSIFSIDQDGHVSLVISDWEAHTLSNPTNIAFGGPSHDQLFCANLGRWHISKIDLGVRGILLPSHFERP